MGKRYQQGIFKERREIFRLHGEGLSIRRVAASLDRARRPDSGSIWYGSPHEVGSENGRSGSGNSCIDRLRGNAV